MGGGKAEDILTGDIFMPESVKKINDKMTPEWAKDLGHSSGLSQEAMGLPQENAEAPGTSTLPETPSLPKAAEAALSKVDEKRRAIARSRTIFTTPLGLGNVANLAKKFLLGE